MKHRTRRSVKRTDKKEYNAGAGQDRVPWQKSMAVTVLLILLMTVCSFFVTWRINRMEEDRSFARLQEETNELVQYIEREAEDDREQLALIATMAAAYEDLASPKLWNILNSYQNTGMISRVEILLPDDTVLTKNGRVSFEGKLSFQEQAALGEHISNREEDLSDGGAYVVRSYVPVQRDGKTVAMLYGVIELGSLPEELAARPYSGDAALYLIEGGSGDFLVDTWHNEPGGNIWDLGERQMAPGYHHEQLKQGLMDGETGYVVFVSQTIGTHLYFYYEPVGINDWRLALSVPENVVFESAQNIRRVLNTFLGFEAVCFALYFVWMLRYVRQVTSEKQRRLDTIQYIYDVENWLFNAHENKENMKLALERIGEITQAELVCLWVWNPSEEKNFWMWEKADKEEEISKESRVTDQKRKNRWEKQEKIAAVLRAHFRNGSPSLLALRPGSLRERLPEGLWDFADTMMAVPVKETDGEICGILACCDLPEKEAEISLLKSVEFSFGMFCHNLNSYNAVKEQGERDALTGLYNRNRYEAQLLRYQKQNIASMACVYLDANGLHELNNRHGHEAGDRMLRTVAKQLRNQFGDANTYRIGGDEFLVFVPNTEKEAVESLCREMTAELDRAQIHVSVGIQWEETVTSITSLIKEAEKKMYADKKAYYEQTCNDRRRNRR